MSECPQYPQSSWGWRRSRRWEDSDTAEESQHWPSVALQPKRLFLGWREGQPLLDVCCYSSSMSLGKGENGVSPRAAALSRGGEVLPVCTSAPTIVSCGEPLTLVCLCFFQHKQGKVGPDGKELIPQESPRVGGFGFVATPSPAPGKK